MIWIKWWSDSFFWLNHFIEKKRCIFIDSSFSHFVYSECWLIHRLVLLFTSLLVDCLFVRVHDLLIDHDPISARNVMQFCDIVILCIFSIFICRYGLNVECHWNCCWLICILSHSVPVIIFLSDCVYIMISSIESVDVILLDMMISHLSLPIWWQRSSDSTSILLVLPFIFILFFLRHSVNRWVCGLYWFALI